MKLLGIVGIVSALLASACASRGPMSYAASPFHDGSGRDRRVQLNLLELLGAAGAGSTTSLETALATFPAEPAPRNQVVGALLMASDRNCDIYMETLRGMQSGWRTSSTMLSTVFGTAGALFTAADTSRALSALSGAASGVSGKLDENVLAGRGAEVLVGGVRKARQSPRTELVTKMGSESYAAWPIGVALADVARYHGHCNVVSGLNALQAAVADTDTNTD